MALCEPGRGCLTNGDYLSPQGHRTPLQAVRAFISACLRAQQDDTRTMHFNVINPRAPGQQTTVVVGHGRRSLGQLEHQLSQSVVAATWAPRRHTHARTLQGRCFSLSRVIPGPPTQELLHAMMQNKTLCHRGDVHPDTPPSVNTPCTGLWPSVQDDTLSAPNDEPTNIAGDRLLNHVGGIASSPESRKSRTHRAPERLGSKILRPRCAEPVLDPS